MVKWKEGFKTGVEDVSKSFLGVGSLWGLIVLLIIVAVIVLIGWVFIISHGFVTAFVGFVAGSLFLWFISKMGVDLSEHTGFLSLPIILGVLGYIAEHYLNFKIPLMIRLAGLETIVGADIYIPINIILMVITTFTLVADFVLKWKGGK